MDFHSKPRTAVFGGSFDPIHLGHLILARDVLEQTDVDRILFMPAYQAPLRKLKPLASAQDRLDLIRASISHEPFFEVSEFELQAKGTSYTVDTIEALLAKSAPNSFSLIIGADQLARLPKWYNVEKLVKMVEFICLDRPGFPLAAPSVLDNLRWRSIKARQMDISSSEIRERFHDGRSVRNLIPEPALALAIERNLYTPENSTN